MKEYYFLCEAHWKLIITKKISTEFNLEKMVKLCVKCRKNIPSSKNILKCGSVFFLSFFNLSLSLLLKKQFLININLEQCFLTFFTSRMKESFTRYNLLKEPQNGFRNALQKWKIYKRLSHKMNYIEIKSTFSFFLITLLKKLFVLKV